MDTQRGSGWVGGGGWPIGGWIIDGWADGQTNIDGQGLDG